MHTRKTKCSVENTSTIRRARDTRHSTAGENTNIYSVAVWLIVHLHSSLPPPPASFTAITYVLCVEGVHFNSYISCSVFSQINFCGFIMNEDEKAISQRLNLTTGHNQVQFRCHPCDRCSANVRESSNPWNVGTHLFPFDVKILLECRIMHPLHPLHPLHPVHPVCI